MGRILGSHEGPRPAEQIVLSGQGKHEIAQKDILGRESRRSTNRCLGRSPAYPCKRPERLGYPTQKPVALLERIISISSNPNDVILDPFCGCGTTVHAAETLKRQWIGIDVTHLAIALIEHRLKAAFPGIDYGVHGVPKDLAGARDLAERDKHEFQPKSGS